MRTVGREPYEAMKALTRQRVQQHHLRRTDCFTCRGLLWLYSEPGGGDGPEVELLSRVYKIPRDQTLAPPFALDLHHAPQKEGDTDVFKATVCHASNSTRRNTRPLPLSTLFNITILMVPPAAVGRTWTTWPGSFCPPSRHLQPPSDLLRTVNLDAVQDGRLKAIPLEKLNSLPKEPKHSVTEYPSIEDSRITRTTQRRDLCGSPLGTGLCRRFCGARWMARGSRRWQRMAN